MAGLPYKMWSYLFRLMLAVSVLCTLEAANQEDDATRKLNVLFIVADDMRPELGAYRGKFYPSPVGPSMYTPNIDKLAKRGFVGLNAHVQYSVCGPSRTSFLTSRRPDTTHVYDNVHYFRKVGGNFTTLPQYFKDNGYISVGMGKIFHPGLEASDFDDPPSWSEPYWHPPNEDYWWLNKTKSWLAVADNVLLSKPLPDQQIKEHALRTLERLAAGARTGQQPFFMAVGFLKPHLPFVFPKKFLKFYPSNKIHQPDNDYAPVGMPSIAWSSYYELRQYTDINRLKVSGGINTTLPESEILKLRRAYYSALTYADDQIGAVLRKLDELGLTNNTIISFVGDHGWQLGEHGEWCKHTNFDLATHAPLIITDPRMAGRGKKSSKPLEFVDIFPTLVDLAGLPSLPRCPDKSYNISLCTEGSSFAELLDVTRLRERMATSRVSDLVKSNWLKIQDEDALNELKYKAFSQFKRSNVMGYSLRNSRYRYTEWVGFSGKPSYQPMWDKLHGVELYDHDLDPEENINVAHHDNYKDIRQQLSQELHRGSSI